MTPEQILQFKAIIDEMQRGQGGITGAAARRWNAVGGLANRFGSYISGRRQAEINKAAEIEKERIRAAEAARRAQYIDTSQYHQRGRTQPGTERSSKRFQGTQKHSRFGRGGGGGFILGDELMGKWKRPRWLRGRYLSEEYTPGPGLLS